MTEETTKIISEIRNVLNRGCHCFGYDVCDHCTFKDYLIPELLQLAELGQAVLEMPYNSSLHHRPLNESDGLFPTGSFPWTFERVGENTADAVDPLTALTFHKLPEGGLPE